MVTGFVFCRYNILFFFNYDITSDIFENGGERNKQLQQIDNEFNDGPWNPFNPEYSNSLNVPGKAIYNQKPPFDSYTPRYNNNPENFQQHFNRYRGVEWDPLENSHRQRGSIDLYPSPSSNRSKKVPGNPNGKPRVQLKQKPKNQKRVPKRAAVATHSLRERDPDLIRELSPPPLE